MFTRNATVQSVEVEKGVIRKILSHSQNIMSVELEFEKGAVGKLHSHPHEQIGYIVSGKLELLGGEEKVILKTGDTYYMAPNEEHGVIALEKTKLLDIFTPRREDFIED